MEPPGATLKTEWLPGRHLASPTVAPTSNFDSVATIPDSTTPASGKHPGCTWPPETASRQRSQMVAAWKGSGDLAKIQQMHEPHVGGVPRSVLSRLLATPGSAPGTPIHSPRRRCSAASASVAAMVYSPRAFANGDRVPFERRDPTAQTLPYQHCCLPTPEFGSFDSNCSSRCSSPIPINHFPDYPIPSDEEEDSSEEEEVVMLRQQVSLLVKSLEDEKKRRASEQYLMQKKIIELQGLIRDNSREDHNDLDMGQADAATSSIIHPSTRENERLENNQVRRWSAPVDEDETGNSYCGCSRKQVDNGEAAAKMQLTRVRARMHAIVIDAQRENQSLRAQLESAKRHHNKREKQLMLETTIKVSALEQKHATATTRLAQQAANSNAQVQKLTAEKQELLACMQAQRERLEQLELALSGKRIVDASR